MTCWEEAGLASDDVIPATSNCALNDISITLCWLIKMTTSFLMSKRHSERMFVGDKKTRGYSVPISFPLVYLLVMNHTVDGWIYIASCSKNAQFVQVSVRLLEDTIDSNTSVLHYIHVRSFYDSPFLEICVLGDVGIYVTLTCDQNWLFSHPSMNESLVLIVVFMDGLLSEWFQLFLYS